MPESAEPTNERRQLEKLLFADLRRLTSDSDSAIRAFAAQNDMSANDFRALLFVVMAEASGKYLTAGDLRRQMGLSGAAVTYLVERMTGSGHLHRHVDPADRRKVVLRRADRGMDVALSFFASLTGQQHQALDGLTDIELAASHRVFKALMDGMRALRTEQEYPPGPNTSGEPSGTP